MTRVTVGFYVVLCKYAVSCSDFSVLFKLNFIDVIKFRMMGMLLVKKKKLISASSKHMLLLK